MLVTILIWNSAFDRFQKLIIYNFFIFYFSHYIGFSVHILLLILFACFNTANQRSLDFRFKKIFRGTKLNSLNYILKQFKRYYPLSNEGNAEFFN